MKKFGLKFISILIGIFIGLILAEIGSRIYFSTRNYSAVGENEKLGLTRKIAVGREKGNDLIRIAFSGDSYTYGFGVEEEHTFPAVLEKMLNIPGNVKVECINFGHRGANIKKELSILKSTILDYSPDIIVHGFVMNDFTHRELQKKNYRFYEEDKKKYRPFRKLEKFSRFLYYLDEAVFGVFGKTKKAQISNLNDLYDPEKNPYYKEMIGSLEKFLKISASYKGIILFFPHFIKNESEQEFYRSSRGIVSSLCEKYNVEFIELLPEFTHKPYFKWWVHPQDHHPNKEAHQVIAEVLSKELKKKDLTGKSLIQ